MTTKRQLLIDTALMLFYHKGINSIGINEVLKESGVAKRTLYSHFASKDELVLAALQQRHTIFMHWLSVKLANHTGNIALISALFQALDSWFNNRETALGPFRGCFFINTSAEFSDTASDIVKYCHYHKRQVRELIASQLADASPLLLDAICLLKEGAIVTAQLQGTQQQAAAESIAILNKLAAP